MPLLNANGTVASLSSGAGLAEGASKAFGRRQGSDELAGKDLIPAGSPPLRGCAGLILAAKLKRPRRGKRAPRAEGKLRYRAAKSKAPLKRRPLRASALERPKQGDTLDSRLIWIS